MKSKSKAIATVFAVMSEVYDKRLSDAAQSIWASTLSDYEPNDIVKSIEMHLKDPDIGKFPPKPADLIAKITGNSKQKDVSIEDQAMGEWEKIKKAIQSTGAYGKYESEDKVAVRAIQSLGGWVALCHTKAETLDTWKRKEFITAYKVSKTAKDLPQYAPGIGQKSQEAIDSKRALENIAGRLG